MFLSVYSELQSAVVLCIDDNAEMLECERSFLECFGYTVLTAPSGDRALELASMHAVDVVVADSLMPKVNGHEVFSEVRRFRPEAPIILLTGGTDIPKRTLNLVDAFIAKDCLASQLLPAIAQLHECGRTALPSYDA
jgi:CheY-like chemotaxis protein